jgi:hypothetical protein
MKKFRFDDGDFRVNVTWIPDRSIIRFESGPCDNPYEMVVEFQGVSSWGARQAVQQQLTHWIGLSYLVKHCLAALGLPE